MVTKFAEVLILAALMGLLSIGMPLLFANCVKDETMMQKHSIRSHIWGQHRLLNARRQFTCPEVRTFKTWVMSHVSQRFRGTTARLRHCSSTQLNRPSLTCFMRMKPLVRYQQSIGSSTLMFPARCWCNGVLRRRVLYDVLRFVWHVNTFRVVCTEPLGRCGFRQACTCSAQQVSALKI